MPADFSEKTVVVTGAAAGIGLAIARRFAAANARVVVGDINAPPKEDGFYYCRADVAEEESARELMRFAAEKAGGPDILVNNAGISAEKELTQTTAEEWDRVFAVNARGVFLCAKHALPFMRARGGGAIVNVGSIEARGANPAHAAYAASKGAVHSLTRNIALEFGAHNIRCNAVAPGWIDTSFNDALLARYANPEAAREKVRAMHPMGKTGSANDVAAAVLWLASEESSFANGQIYVQDGGRTACLPTPQLKE